MAAANAMMQTNDAVNSGSLVEEDPRVLVQDVEINTRTGGMEDPPKQDVNKPRFETRKEGRRSRDL